MNLKSLTLITILAFSGLGLGSNPSSTPDEWAAAYLALSAKTKKPGKKKRPKSTVVSQVVAASKLTPAEREEIRMQYAFTINSQRHSRTDGYTAPGAKELNELFSLTKRDDDFDFDAIKQAHSRLAKAYGKVACESDFCLDGNNRTYCKSCRKPFCSEHITKDTGHTCTPACK